MFWTSLTQQGN